MLTSSSRPFSSASALVFAAQPAPTRPAFSASVSYTHLDVYKRQAGNRDLAILSGYDAAVALEGTDPLLQAHVLLADGLVVVTVVVLVGVSVIAPYNSSGVDCIEMCIRDRA